MRYRILEPIGKGGMGEVFLAEDTELERKVALKFLPEALQTDATALARLRREAKSAAALDHPYICKVYDTGETEDGRAFIAMEYVEGETLASRLERERPSLIEALRIGLEVVEALEKAHERRIVHRDLKPGNVMLGRDGHVKVMDFGLAKQVEVAEVDSEAETIEGVSRRGHIVGTPGYMSPEQLRGESVDGRSDLFAFGIVLQEILTGTHPFRRESGAETMAAILKESPNGREALPAVLQPLVDQLLSKKADDRPSHEHTRSELQRLVERPELLEASATPERIFVGRASELRELRNLAERLRSGKGSLALVGGEPGVGKTRLCEEILAFARTEGFLTLEGHCYEMEGAQPYLPWIEGLEQASRTIPREEFREALGDSASEIAKLMPGLRQIFDDIGPPIELPPEQQRRYLFNNFQEFVTRSSRERPVVWLLDDLHWADESSLHLLQHLAQNLNSLPVLILGTYRDVELDVGKPFEKVLAQLVRQRLARRLTLRRLPRASVAELLSALGGGPPPESLVDTFYRETEGNPFFVEEVFEHLSEEGKLFAPEGNWKSGLSESEIEVPAGVRLVIGRRLERLSEATPEVLTAAAVMGKNFHVHILESVEGLRSADVLDAIEEAEKAKLVAPGSQAREPTYAFTHALIRQTLLSGLSLPRRQRLHVRIATALEAAGSKQVADLAHHLLQAGAAADPGKTAHYLHLAAKRALEASAAQEACAYLDEALSLELDDDALRAQILIERGDANRRLGLLEEAVQDWEAALPLFERLGDRQAVASICYELSDHLWNTLGRVGESLRAAQRGLQSVGTDPSAERCRLLAVQGGTLSSSRQYQSAESSLAEAEDIARTLGDGHLEAGTLIQSAVRYWIYLRLAPGIVAGERAVELMRSAGDLWGLANALAWTQAHLLYSGRREDAESLHDELESLSSRLGHVFALWVSYIDQLHYKILDGDLPGLESRGQKILDWARTVGIPWGIRQTLGLLSLGELWGGRQEAALELAHESVEEEGSELPVSSRATLMLVQAYGGGSDALRQLDALELPTSGVENDLGKQTALLFAAPALAVLGEDDRAAELYPLMREPLENMKFSPFGALMPETAPVSPRHAAALGMRQKLISAPRSATLERSPTNWKSRRPGIGTPRC